VEPQEQKPLVVEERAPFGAWDYEPITDKARRLVFGERGEKYGHPVPEATRIALLWSAYLTFDVKPEDYPVMMMLVKIAREAHAHQTDNLIDIAGYAEVLERIHVGQAAEEEARNSPEHVAGLLRLRMQELANSLGANVTVVPLPTTGQPAPPTVCEFCNGANGVGSERACVFGPSHTHSYCDTCYAEARAEFVQYLEMHKGAAILDTAEEEPLPDEPLQRPTDEEEGTYKLDDLQERDTDEPAEPAKPRRRYSLFGRGMDEFKKP
jgi:hypothetical protein